MPKSKLTITTTPMRLGVGFVVGMLRDAYNARGAKRAIEVGREILVGVPDEQALAIAEGRATLRGFVGGDSAPITYHDVRCLTCGGGGRDGYTIAACPACLGDGFDPPAPIDCADPAQRRAINCGHDRCVTCAARRAP